MIRNLLLISLITIIWGNSNVSELNKNASFLYGSVANNNDGYVVEANIVIENLITKKSYSLVTNDDGEYKISLLPSVYKIEVKKAGFCPQTRAPFEIKSNEKLNINLNLLVCSIESIVVVEKEKKNSGIISQYQIPYKEDKLIIDTINSLTGNAWIQYGKKNFLNNKVNYEEISFKDNTTASIYLSYNTIQVSTNSLTLKSPNTFNAKGNVVFEDGKNRYKFEEVVFTLKDGKYTFISSKPNVDVNEN